MKLYTICAHNRPVVTMSVNCEMPMPDSLTTNAALMKSIRDERALEDQRMKDPNWERQTAAWDIEEALDTYLGEDLLCLESEGLWSGRREDLDIREATADEAKRWEISHRTAINTGDLDAGEESWLTFLLPVLDPTDLPPVR